MNYPYPYPILVLIDNPITNNEDSIKKGSGCVCEHAPLKGGPKRPYQMYVTSALLNGDLKEKVYMTQPEGFEEEGEKHFFAYRVKVLYGLK
jgi:hypothetical protein